MNQQPISPAVNALRNVVRSSVTSMHWSYNVAGQPTSRLQWRAGEGQMQHLTGLALDIILYAAVPHHRVLAHHLFSLFAQHQTSMQWLTMIYEDVCLVPRGGTLQPQPYPDPHRRHFTHIHIDWYRPNVVHGETVQVTPESQNTGFQASLRQDLMELNNLWSNNLLSPVNLRETPLGLYVLGNARL
jgi:hypothetical protein